MKIRRKRKTKNKKIIIISITLLLFITIGYAAFSTNLSLTAKGNIQPRNNLYVSSNGSDTTGNGTKEKPYLTVQKAYDSAWENATIWIMDNITIDKTVQFNQDKNITLTSEENEINSLLRGEEKETIILINAGKTTFTNITLDGQNKEANHALLRGYMSEINLEKGTTIQNNIDLIDHGGGANFSRAIININGATFSNNIATDGGGGFLSRNSNITINNGNFISNSSKNSTGGAIFFGDKGYTLTINNAIFKNNKAFSSGGAITIASATLKFNGGEISNNEAQTYNGGGILAYSLLNNPDNGYSNITINGGLISNNKASKNGGGIYLVAGNTYNYIKGTISNNTPNNVYQE